MAFSNCLKFSLRFKYTDARVGNFMKRRSKIAKHWNNESVRQNAIDKREKLIFENPPGLIEAERRWTSEMDDELDCDSAGFVLAHREKIIEQCVRQVDHFEKVKQLKTIERKYFRKPPEVNLLTWAMKEKIRYLHNTDPETWTFQELSEGFPISPEGVKRLLKNKSVLTTTEKIRLHDQTVTERWRKVDGPIAAKIENANKWVEKINETVDFSRHDEEDFEEDLNSKKIGIFTSILVKANSELIKKQKPETNRRETSSEDRENTENCSKINPGKQFTAEEFRKQAGIETKPKPIVDYDRTEKKIEYNSGGYVSKYKNPRKYTNPDLEERLIQHGDTFYDEKGQFVYRIPGLYEKNE
uniref:Uncharacterized protein n=1 Tax=Strigamia maritima TaxID=126957 RepID=T1J7N9_STRMM